MDEETLAKFNELKEYWGTKSNMNTIEKLLSEGNGFFEKQMIKLLPEQEKAVEEHVESRLFSSSTSVRSFVNNAVSLWLEERKEKMNLNDMTFRSFLPDDEREIATVLFEKQFESGGLTGEEIEKLTGLKSETVAKKLEKFVNHGMLRKVVDLGEEKYIIIE